MQMYSNGTYTKCSSRTQRDTVWLKYMHQNTRKKVTDGRTHRNTSHNDRH